MPVPHRDQALRPAAFGAQCTPRANIQTALQARVRECLDVRALALRVQAWARHRVSARLRLERRTVHRAAINSGAERAIDTRNPKKAQ